MSESDKSFIVNDRRHFTPDGRVREEPEVDTPEAPVVPEGFAERADPSPPKPPTDPDPENQPGTPSPEARPESSPGSESRRDRSSQEADPAEFGQFVLSLGAQAAMLLAGQGLPEGAEPREALMGARSIISILEMLRGKTEGRRTPEEDQILDGLLYELRMAYLEKSRAAGS